MNYMRKNRPCNASTEADPFVIHAYVYASDVQLRRHCSFTSIINTFLGH